MKGHRLWSGVLALGSVAISLLFAFLGLGTLVSTKPPQSAVLFAALLLFYGLWTLVLLGLAFWRGNPMVIKISKFSGLGLFAAIVIGSLDVGMISGLEWLMIVFMGSLLWLQFVAVRRMVGENARA